MPVLRYEIVSHMPKGVPVTGINTPSSAVLTLVSGAQINLSETTFLFKMENSDNIFPAQLL